MLPSTYLEANISGKKTQVNIDWEMFLQGSHDQNIPLWIGTDLEPRGSLTYLVHWGLFIGHFRYQKLEVPTMIKPYETYVRAM